VKDVDVDLPLVIPWGQLVPQELEQFKTMAMVLIVMVVAIPHYREEEEVLGEAFGGETTEIGRDLAVDEVIMNVMAESVAVATMRTTEEQKETMTSTLMATGINSRILDMIDKTIDMKIEDAATENTILVVEGVIVAVEERTEGVIVEGVAEATEIVANHG